MWGVYYGMYVVTEKKKHDTERTQYYKIQNEKLSNGEIQKIIPFKEISVCFFK